MAHMEINLTTVAMEHTINVGTAGSLHLQDYQQSTKIACKNM
jgi:hypothetical protein